MKQYRIGMLKIHEAQGGGPQTGAEEFGAFRLRTIERILRSNCESAAQKAEILDDLLACLNK